MKKQQKKLVKEIRKYLVSAVLVSSFGLKAEMKQDAQFIEKDPKIIINSDEILKSGHINIGDVINELTLTSTDMNQYINNGGDNSIVTEFRYAGRKGTIVLLNGNRWNDRIIGGVDLSIFPIAMIKEIHIYSEQASSKNNFEGGMGVINIITKTKQSELEVNSYYGISERGDAEKKLINSSVENAYQRGSVFFSAEYSKSEPILSGDRDISRLPRFGTGNTQGSTATPQGRFMIFTPTGSQNLNEECGNYFGLGLSNCTTPPGSNGIQGLNDPDLMIFTDEHRYNYAPVNYLLTPQEKLSVYLNNRYEINENTQWNTEFLYVRNKVKSQHAPEPFGFGYAISSLPGYGDINIGGENPYNPYGVNIPSSDIYLIGRRMVEAGNRVFRKSIDNYYLNTNLDGYWEKGSGWDWNLSGSYNEQDMVSKDTGLIDRAQFRESLSNECIQDESCVPLNIFGGEGSITPAMVDYISGINRDRSNSKLTTLNFELRSKVFKEHVDFKVGLNHENRDIEFLKGRFHSRGNANPLARSSYNGHFDLRHLYTDIAFSLWESSQSERHLKSLIQLGYTDTSASKADSSYSFNLNWNLNNDFDVNLNHAKSLRQPTMFELFAGEVYVDRDVSDPCLGRDELPGCPLNYNSQGFEGIVPQYHQGNENLEAEKLTTTSFDLSYQVNQNLRVNLNAYQYEVTNLVQNLGGQEILDSCAYTGNLHCERIEIQGEQFFYVDRINGSYINKNDVIKVAGIDLILDYGFETSFGNFNINWQTSYLDKLKYISNYNQRLQLQGIEPTILDYLSISQVNVLSINQGDYDRNYKEKPRVKSNLTTQWQNQNWSVNYQFRFIEGHEEMCNPDFNNNIIPDEFTPNDFIWCTYGGEFLGSIPEVERPLDKRHVGGTTFQDLNISYALNEYNSTITLGVENLFDKTPPLSSTANADSHDKYFYNATGRYFWLHFNKKF